MEYGAWDMKHGVRCHPNVRPTPFLLQPSLAPSPNDQISLKWSGIPAATDKSYLVSSGMPAAYGQN
ncbi:hypothetical protein DDZ16_13365 [Marinilabilia rubra]|uniref:Uncharacterized protein n=1 Tax=Marinilabilia rubra TaxID=2162893 RepID=A0A2U2B6R2_9BACT|nr:hypothetical protein DDZ16_13365 [Marinilabilia rubra]